ncbi:MAG: hypothetical protein VX237_04160, partial [Chloroflexota bacterium]|nr:hypothetical protein [Chloroflexota bacterium]
SYSVSLIRNTLAIGAPGEDSNQTTITTSASSNNSNSASGAVYVYEKTGTSWAMQAFIKAANNDASDQFGSSVAINGETIAAGAPEEDSNQTTITNGTSASSNDSSAASGAVYVYKRTGTSWNQEAYIKSDNMTAGDNFGHVLAIYGDTLAVGAIGEDSNQTSITNGINASSNNSNTDSGAVYIYKRSGATWAQEAYIKAVNNGASDNFGYSLSLNGETLAVGVYKEDSNQTSITNGTSASSDNSNADSGAVYIYKRSGTSWSQEAYIKAANNRASDNFGYSVSLHADSLAVGAPGEDSNHTPITNGTSASYDDSNSASGAFYIYKRSGTTWAQEAYIKAV